MQDKQSRAPGRKGFKVPEVVVHAQKGYTGVIK